MSARQPSKNRKTIHSYFAHDQRLKQIFVDSQATNLEPSNKHESEITYTEHGGWKCPRKCSCTEADITNALNAEDNGNISIDRTICARFEPHPSVRSFPRIVSKDHIAEIFSTRGLKRRIGWNGIIAVFF